MSEQIVVIGGNAAGMSAASRAKRLRPDLDITILEMSHFISYSICGLPYYIGGQVEDHQQLISFTPEQLERERGLLARLRVRVDEILPGRRSLLCTELESQKELELPYDRLVIATGYIPKVPAIKGTELENVLTVSRLEDGLRIRYEVQRQGLQRAAIIGGGYVGLMMATALKEMGLQVLLFERNRHVFSQVDDDVALLLEEELQRRGVHLFLGAGVRELSGVDGRLTAVCTQEGTYAAQLALVDVGIVPNTRLAEAANISCGISGAIAVDGRGQTRAGGIFACGNCAETRHLVSGRPVVAKLGTTAAKQGRVVGENLAGVRSRFSGTLETSVEKVFDLSVARTGLTTREALRAGFEVDSVLVSDRDRNSYYPGSAALHVKLVFEKSSGRLLGGQLLGAESAAKRIDTLVAALTARMTLEDLAQLDLAYAPPLGTLWDPIQIAANVARRKL